MPGEKYITFAVPHIERLICTLYLLESQRAIRYPTFRPRTKTIQQPRLPRGKLFLWQHFIYKLHFLKSVIVLVICHIKVPAAFSQRDVKITSNIALFALTHFYFLLLSVKRPHMQFSRGCGAQMPQPSNKKCFTRQDQVHSLRLQMFRHFKVNTSGLKKLSVL